jgi:hypothetical protein
MEFIIHRQLMSGKFVSGFLLELALLLAADTYCGSFWKSPSQWPREIHCGSSGTHVSSGR